MWLRGWIGEPHQIFRSRPSQDLLEGGIVVLEKSGGERDEVLRPLGPSSIGNGGMAGECRAVPAEVVLPPFVVTLNQESSRLVVRNRRDREDSVVILNGLEQRYLARLRSPRPEAGQQGRSDG